jgi:uncharacterized membrane protein
VPKNILREAIALKQWNDKVAAVITQVVTSMWFLYGFVVFISLWMWLAPLIHWDRSPNFPVMLYWVNLFQALMLPILAVGQMVLNRAGEIREKREFEIVEKLDRLLAHMNTDLSKVHKEVSSLDVSTLEKSRSCRENS